MSYNACTDKITFSGIKETPLHFGQVIAFKYLGVPISCAPRILFRDFNKNLTGNTANISSAVGHTLKKDTKNSEIKIQAGHLDFYRKYS